MLRIIYGFPKVTIFEFDGDAEYYEQSRRNTIYGHTRLGSACFRGFTQNDRDSISKEIYEKFKTTEHYLSICEMDKKMFDDFFYELYLGKTRHPVNRSRTFYYGDILEPNFLGRTLNLPKLEGTIERVLNVQFYKL
jgi:hypothetical protein